MVLSYALAKAIYDNDEIVSTILPGTKLVWTQAGSDKELLRERASLDHDVGAIPAPDASEIDMPEWIDVGGHRYELNIMASSSISSDSGWTVWYESDNGDKVYGSDMALADAMIRCLIEVEEKKEMHKNVPTEPMDSESDTSHVHHPSHYNNGSIEAIDVIVDWKLGFHLGNVIKYIARYRHKGDPKGDLMKAREYLDDFINRGLYGDETRKE